MAALDDNEKLFIERCQRMGDRLVARGYATRVVFDDGAQRLRVVWTAKGSALRRSLRELFKEFAAEDQPIDNVDVVAMLCIFLRTGDRD